MSETIYNKLVRDKILDIISESGKKSTFHIAGEEEYSVLLEEKLNEELDEFSLTPTAEEAADIIQVVYALFENKGLSLQEIEQVRIAKEQKRGGFKRRIILETVSDDSEKR